MKPLVSLFIFCLSFVSIHAQQFTWMRGGTTNSAVAGAYGTMGVATSANDPGTRHGSAHWTDASGNLWLFGGEGNDATGTFGWLNDLWKYDVSTNLWTWIGGSNTRNQVSVYGQQGVASPTCYPGAREFAVSWTDNSGNFWLFGGDGFAATSGFGRIGDLWKYNPNTNEWAWMSGFTATVQPGNYGTMGVPAATNMPGCRYAAAVWTDLSGNLWLFGGEGIGSTASAGIGLLNDLWRYNIATNQWTWMHGNTGLYPAGSYGTQMAAAATNTPPPRQWPSYWTTSSGLLYLFGGGSYNSGNTYLNDVWKYDPATNQWTWVNGSSTPGQLGVYGSLGVASPSTQPGGRFSQTCWKDDNGDFWIFGGNGFAASTIVALNDVFRYNYTSNQWTWMAGSSSGNQNGTYGTQGIPSPANIPGGREYNVWWKGLNNTLWLFGGIGQGITGSGSSLNSMNDLWRYSAPCFGDSINTAHTICSGNTVTLSLPSLSEGQAVWYPTASSTSSLASGSSYTATLSAATSQSVYSFYAEVASCTTTPRAMTTITVNALPVLSVTPSFSFCNGMSGTLTASGASTYVWNTMATASVVQVTPALPSYDYTVTGTDTSGCSGTLINAIPVHPVPSLTLSTSNPSILCLGNTATLTAAGSDFYSWSNNNGGPTVAVTPTASTSYTVTGSTVYGCESSSVILQTVTPLPQLTLTTHPICYGTTGTLTASGSNSYLWNGTYAGTSMTVSPGQPSTDYTVVATDTTGCQNTGIVTQLVEACEGIQNYNANNRAVSLYPNPNRGEFTLTVSELPDASYLVIFTALGQKVMEQTLQSGNNSIKANLATGLYYYQAQSAGQPLATGKFIVE